MPIFLDEENINRGIFIESKAVTDLEAWKQEIKALTDQIAAIEGETKDLENQIKTQQKDLVALNTDILIGIVGAKVNQILIAEKTVSLLMERLERYKSKKPIFEEAIAQKQKDITELEQHLERLTLSEEVIAHIDNVFLPIEAEYLAARAALAEKIKGVHYVKVEDGLFRNLQGFRYLVKAGDRQYKYKNSETYH